VLKISSKIYEKLKKIHPRLAIWVVTIVLMLVTLPPLYKNQVTAHDGEIPPLREIPTLKKLNLEKQSNNMTPDRQINVVANKILFDREIVKSKSLESIPKEVIDQTKAIFRNIIKTTQTGDKPHTLYILYQAEFGQSGIPDSGKILAAEIIYGNKSEQVVLHEKASGENLYLTPTGRFFEADFLRSPLKSFKRISSKFSNSRVHPILEEKRSHKGLDYAAKLGTEVRAVADGKVLVKNYSESFGNLIAIAHTNNIETRYGHLLKFSSSIKVGDQVKKGEIIGYVGMTGLATAPHLHFEFLENGKQVDPRKMASMSYALDSNEKKEFVNTTTQYLKALEEFKDLEKL